MDLRVFVTHLGTLCLWMTLNINTEGKLSAAGERLLWACPYVDIKEALIPEDRTVLVKETQKCVRIKIVLKVMLGTYSKCGCAYLGHLSTFLFRSGGEAPSGRDDEHVASFHCESFGEGKKNIFFGQV